MFDPCQSSRILNVAIEKFMMPLYNVSCLLLSVDLSEHDLWTQHMSLLRRRADLWECVIGHEPCQYSLAYLTQVVDELIPANVSNLDL